MKTQLFLIFFLCSAHECWCTSTLENNLLEQNIQPNSSDSIKNKIIELNDLSWDYMYVDYDTALYYNFLALNLAKKHSEKYPNELSNAYGTSGILHDLIGKNDHALKMYLASLEIKEKLGDSSGIANVKTNIGAMYFSQSNYEKALPYFYESLSLEQALSDTLAQIGSLINISVILKNQSNIELANATLHSALRLSKIAREDEYMGEIYNNLGAQYLTNNQLDSAYYFFQNGFDHSLISGNKFYRSIALENLAQIELRQNQVKQALNTAQQSLSIAKKEGYLNQLQQIYATLSDIHLAQLNFDSSAYYSSLASEIQQEVLDKENRKIIDEIEASYKLKQKNNELKIQQIALEDEKKFSTYFILISAAIGTLAFLLMIIIIMRIRSERKLKEKNELIANSLAEKEVLMREIHHRVKNNIQAIKSIINIQSRKSQSEETKESLKQTLNRVNAMALIHSKLYQQENLTQLSAASYFEELSHDVLKSFGHDPEDMLEYQVADITLLPDQLLTLGIIFNELITNACKYGVDQDEQLKLSILGQRAKNEYQLHIRDYGPGKHSKENGFGTELMEALAQKVKGSLSYKTDSGTHVCLKFKLNESKN